MVGQGSMPGRGCASSLDTSPPVPDLNPFSFPQRDSEKIHMESNRRKGQKGTEEEMLEET